MVKSKNHILTGVGFFMLVVTLILLSPQRSYAPPGSSPPLNVNVVNPETAPVPTYDVDHPAFQPRSFFDRLTILDGVSFGSIVVTTVPQDKLLVIEHVSGTANLQFSEVLRAFEIGVVTNGEAAVHFIPIFDPTEADGIQHYSLGTPIRLYADPQSEVTISVARFPLTGNASFEFAVSGHLVDVD